MNYLKQFCIIMFFSFLGEILHELLPFPIPASIYGIVLLFAALEFKFLSLEKVKDTGKFLIDIMPILFIPSTVGLMDAWGLVKDRFVPYLIVPFVSTVLVMGVSGLVTQFVIHQDKKQGKSARKQEEVEK